MTIGFDASDLCTDRADGTTRYTRELLRRLPQLAPEHRWTLFAPCDVAQEFSRRPGTVRSLSSPWPGAWTQTRFPLDLLRATPDVLFMPIQQLPYLRPGRMRTVAVIHDLAVHYYPEQFRFKDWLLLHVFSAYAAREADEIIAVSQATADDVFRYYGRKERVHVVHHGVDHDRFRPPRADEAKLGWEKLISAFSHLRRPYLLYVGQLQPRKNLLRLVRAFEAVKRRSPQLQLVIAGGHGWLQQPILDALAASPVSSDIIRLGVLPDNLLAPLYWNADVFVLPSLYEGFGMPILEAMACGCPVVCSAVSSMPEVAGAAAILVDPHDVQSIAHGIDEARESSAIVRERGLAQAQQFTWETTARKTLNVIQQAAAHIAM